ncbi:MAG: response regulator [Chloroflexota bacterium]
MAITATVLLADDHAVVRAGIRNALTELTNLTIVGEVGDGPSVFQALAQAEPDCLLIDVTMPNFEPIRDIGQIHHQYPAMKILVVSAYDDDVYVQGLLGVGVNGYHLKDQPLSDLKLAVERIMAGERWVSSRLVNKLVSFVETPPATRPTLTQRQQEILQWLYQGLDNQTIARQMSLSVKTIENHLTRLYRQLNVQSRLEAVNYIVQHPDIIGTKPAELSQPKTAPESQKQGWIAILLVDDNTRYRSRLHRMVNKVCPQALIQEASNINSAIKSVEQIQPRLIFVDVVLGDEDGIHCTRRIKAIAPQSRVVLMSAYPDREFHRLGLEAGAIAFLDKKDLDAAALHQVIDDVM